MGGLFAEESPASQRPGGINPAAIIRTQEGAAAVVVVVDGQPASLGFDRRDDDVEFCAGEPRLTAGDAKATTLGRAVAGKALDDVAGLLQDLQCSHGLTPWHIAQSSRRPLAREVRAGPDPKGRQPFAPLARRKAGSTLRRANGAKQGALGAVPTAQSREHLAPCQGLAPSAPLTGRRSTR